MIKKTVREKPLYSRDCYLCGCPLALVPTHEGKTVTLDLHSPIYAVVPVHGRNVAVRTGLAFVSHFCTCPNKNEVRNTHQDQSTQALGGGA